MCNGISDVCLSASVCWLPSCIFWARPNPLSLKMDRARFLSRKVLVDSIFFPSYQRSTTLESVLNSRSLILEMNLLESNGFQGALRLQ